LADHQISLEAMQQKEHDTGEVVPVIMLTHETTEGNLQAAMKRITGLSAVEDEVLILRKESFAA
jgi:homoserine dehydrogenase